MRNTQEIIGCYISITEGNYNANQKTKDIASEQGDLFKDYIFGEKGISEVLKKMKHQDYGQDIELILFQFYVNPLPIEIENLKDIENYKKKEKAIGVPVIINNENFFSKSKQERLVFLKQIIISKLDLLAQVVANKKLDTNTELLKSDLEKLLANI